MIQFDNENGDRVGNSAVAWGEGGNRNFTQIQFSAQDAIGRPTWAGKVWTWSKSIKACVLEVV